MIDAHDSAPFLPPQCVSTTELLQLVLDGERPSADLDADAHAATCPPCRQRIRGARWMVTALASPVPPSSPPGFTESILAAVREDRLSRLRRRSYGVAVAAVAAVAACLMVVSWRWTPYHAPVSPEKNFPSNHRDQASFSSGPSIAPEPRVVRLGEEFARVGQALRDTSKPIIEPAASASEMFGMLTSSLTQPTPPVADFQGGNPLTDLSGAARVGLEPVTSTTQKAFARLVRDIGGVQVSFKPKS